MNKNKINLLKFICYVFAILWVYRVIIGFYNYYTLELQMYDKEFSLIRIIGFWAGIALSLIASAGFTTLFWYSYKLKYNEEKIFDNITRKIIAFLFATGVFKAAFGFSIFILSLFFTLVIFIKYLEKESCITN